MHDGNEYPGFARHHVWYVDEEREADTTIFSPVFDIDRAMGISDAITPRPPHLVAPTGATGVGRNDHLMRTVPIGTRVLVQITEVSGGAATNPLFQIWVSCGEANPVTEILWSSTVIPIGGNLELDVLIAFPFCQFRVINTDTEFGSTAQFCGAARITPF